MSFIRTRTAAWGLAGLFASVLVAQQCAPSEPRRAQRAGTQSDIAQAAMATCVAPGDLDEYYFFASGGHSGRIRRFERFEPPHWPTTGRCGKLGAEGYFGVTVGT